MKQTGFMSKLSPVNVEERHFLSFYIPTNAQLEDKGEFSEWCERMIFIYEDLKWLLTLPTLQFWNQVVNDPSWMTSLDSFLQNCPRHYDLKNIPENCKSALSRVSRLYLLAVKRMSIHNEDESCQMSEEEFGVLIYENYLFDAPKLLDICAIFNRGDDSMKQMVSELLHNIFHCQLSYFDDISGAFESMVYTIGQMEERLNTPKGGKPVNGREAIDMVLFFYDMTSSIASFLSLFPNGCKLLFRTTTVTRLTTVYETLVPTLMNLIEVNQKKYKYVSSKIQKNIVQVIVDIIKHTFIGRIGENSKEVNESLTMEYISIMDALSQYKMFFARYCTVGTISNDLKVIQSLNVIDMSNLDYLSEMAGIVVQENAADQTIKQLRELLPHKTEEFLQNCIAQYGNNTEAILNNVLEGNIEDQTLPKTTMTKKKMKAIPDKQFLEDNKEHIARVKLSLYNQEEEGGNYDNYDNVYDDEYDDTYDSQDIGAIDTDNVDELSMRRKFTVPRVLQQLNRANKKDVEDGDLSESDEENEDEGEDEDADGEKKEETNEQINQNSQQFNKNNRGGRGNPRGRGGRGGEGGRGGSRGGRGNKNRGVERPYDKKDENNSRNGGNNPRGRGRGRGRGGKHNRRVLADKKMSKGMF